MALPMHRTSRRGSGIRLLRKSWKARRLAARSRTRNIASAKNRGHRRLMHRFFAFALIVLIAGCAPRPQTATPPPPPVQPQVEEPNSLTGLTAQELVGRFGT